MYLPQAHVRWGSVVFNVRGVVLGLPPSDMQLAVTRGNPKVALDGGIIFFVDPALLHLPGVYLAGWGGPSGVLFRTSLSMQNVSFSSFKMVPPVCSSQ